MIDFRRLLVSILFPALLLLGAPLAHAAQYVSVARPEINMRSGPGTGHAALWRLSRGYPLSVIGKKGAWFKVRDFENDRGWVLGSLTNRTPHRVVKVRLANVRRAPQPRARIVLKAQQGDVLRSLELRGDWVKVRHENGVTGWIARRLTWGW